MNPKIGTNLRRMERPRKGLLAVMEAQSLLWSKEEFKKSINSTINK